MSSTQAPLNVFIGVFARNEAERIPNLLDDLAEQTLMRAPNLRVGIAVIANGCSDATAEVVRTRFDRSPFRDLSHGATVIELERAGKSNAWNEFVHAIVPKQTDYVFFLDADIRIPEPGALQLVLDSLAASEMAVVAVDRSVKDIESQAPRTLSERLIKAGTGTANDTRKAIAGALYCVRYAEVSAIWLPIGLPGEDGFVRAMLLTSSFAHEERIHRHLFVGGAYHVFESLRDVRSVTRHNVRLAIGTAINILLFHHLRRVLKEGEHLATYIRRRNDEEPDWVNELVRERLKSSYFPLEPKWLTRRLRDRRSLRSARDVAVLAMGAAFDLIVFVQATRLMRRGAGAGYW